MKLFEWHSNNFASHKAKIPELIQYLSQVWENRNRYVELDVEISEEEEQEEKIQKQRFFDFTVDGKISARNYVGVVQYDGIRVEVYPKIFANNESHNYQLYQQNILYWLSYCRKIKFPFSFADVSDQNFDDILELLIYIFAHYTEEVIANQPFQAYQTIEEDTPFLKGRISFDNYTKKNLITGNWQNFYCSHEPFVYDNLFNRIVKFIARKLYTVSENINNREKLSEIIFILDEVTDLNCTASDCEKVKLNSLYNDHKSILNLCKLFLSNQVIDLENQDSNNFCFLLPMEYIFEDFIYGFISHHWPKLNVSSQSTSYLAESNSQPVFQIKNDIYIEHQLIIDTKYKIRKTNDGLKAGVAQNDLYQMVSYALTRNSNSVILLYPKSPKGENNDAHFVIQSGLILKPINIHVRNVDISFDDINQADHNLKVDLEHIIDKNLY